MTFLIAGDINGEPVYMPRAEGMRVLARLGWNDELFGYVSAREVAARCRRQLWPSVAIDDDMRGKLLELLALAEHGGEGDILYS